MIAGLPKNQEGGAGGRPVQRVSKLEFKLCDELSLQPTVFCRWQKEFFENGAVAFGRQTRSGKASEQQQMAALERKLQRRNEVLAELMDEHLALKSSMVSRGIGS